MIEVYCPGCRTSYSVPQSSDQVRCAVCQSPILIRPTIVSSESGQVPFAKPIDQPTPAIPTALPIPTTSVSPTPASVPSPVTTVPTTAPVAAGPLPPHLAAGGVYEFAAPTMPAPQFDVAEGDTNDEAVKSRFTQSSGGMGLMLTILGSTLVLVLVISMVAVYFAKPELFSYERNRVESDGAATTRIVKDADGNVEISWADAAAKSVLRNDIRVRIVRVEFGAILARDASNTVQKSGSANYLQIFLALENTGKSTVNYRSWYGNEFDVEGTQVAATLRDDSGHTYQMMTFGDVSAIAGHISSAALGMRNVGDNVRTAKDVVIYEIPEDINRSSHKFYQLQMPAAAIGGKGFIRFQIPADMVTDSSS